MKKICLLQATAVFFFLLILFSCGVEETGGGNRQQIQQDNVTAVSPESKIKENAAARVTDNGLRVRSEPYLDSDIKGFLSAEETVLAESRTEWQETINGRKSSWYFIRTDKLSGWVFGGFLDFKGNPEIHVDPAVPSPEKRKISESGYSDKNKTGKIEITEINPAELPQIMVSSSQRPDCPGKTGGYEGSVLYDPVTQKLIIPFNRNPESPFYRFLEGESSEKLKIAAKKPSGENISVEYSGEELQLYSNCTENQKETVSDALLIPFCRLPSLENGSWEFYVFTENNWPDAVGKINIEPSCLFISDAETENPFCGSGMNNFAPGTILYIYGRIIPDSPGCSSACYLGLFRNTGSKNRGKSAAEPVKAFLIKPGTAEYWEFQVAVDKSFSCGSYTAAVLGSGSSGYEIMNNAAVPFTIIDNNQ